MAVFRSSTPLSRVKKIVADLDHACRNIVLAGDLHLLYLIVPVECSTIYLSQNNWKVLAYMVSLMPPEKRKGFMRTALSRRMTPSLWNFILLGWRVGRRWYGAFSTRAYTALSSRYHLPQKQRYSHQVGPTMGRVLGA